MDNYSKNINVFLIVNYNDYENTFKLLKNIENYDIIDEIVVVDNNSKKDIQDKLKKIKISKLTILFSKENNGYGCAINIGCKSIKGKYTNANVFISNSDIIINKEDDLIKLIQNLNNDDKMCAIAPVINQNKDLVCGWRLPSILDALILNIPKFNKKFERKKLLYNYNDFENGLNEVEVISGCFFLIKLDALEKINYFDENLFLYYEENTIFYKLKKLGYKVYVNKNIEIIHNHSKTIDKNINKKKKLKILKNSQEYYYKNIVKANKFLFFLLKISNKIVLLK